MVDLVGMLLPFCLDIWEKAVYKLCDKLLVHGLFVCFLLPSFRHAAHGLDSILFLKKHNHVFHTYKSFPIRLRFGIKV